jgi:FG-GAP-like repeat
VDPVERLPRGRPAPAAGNGTQSVAVGDLNGDGHPDLAVANSTDNDVSVLLGDGSGSFSVPANFSTHTLPYSVAIGDVNGDAHPDLAVANSSSNDVSVLLNGSFVGYW